MIQHKTVGISPDSIPKFDGKDWKLFPQWIIEWYQIYFILYNIYLHKRAWYHLWNLSIYVGHGSDVHVLGNNEDSGVDQEAEEEPEDD